MKGPVSFGFLFAFVFIIVKMTMHFGGLFEGNILPTSFLNILLLLLAVAIGLYQYIRNREPAYETLLQEVKQGLKPGIVYTLLVSGFLFLYYNNIDRSIIETMQQQRIEEFSKGLENPSTLAEIRKSNEAFELMTPEEILEEVKSNVDQFISAKSLFLMSLMSLMLLSIIYSLLVTIIYRNVLFRK